MNIKNLLLTFLLAISVNQIIAPPAFAGIIPSGDKQLRLWLCTYLHTDEDINSPTYGELIPLDDDEDPDTNPVIYYGFSCPEPVGHAVSYTPTNLDHTKFVGHTELNVECRATISADPYALYY